MITKVSNANYNFMLKNVMFALWMCLGISIVSSEIQAQNNINDTQLIVINGKKFFVYQVLKGEGLYRIAQKFDTTIEEIQSCNQNFTTSVSEGQLIKIPYKNTIPTDTSATNYYQVKKGDTAYSIAQKNKISLEKLYSLNPEIQNGLNENQFIKIPLNEENDRTLDGYYVIERGDTPYNVAKKAEISLDELYQLNPTLKTGEFPLGAKILIQKTETDKLSDITQSKALSKKYIYYHLVLKGETLFYLAKQYDVSQNDIIASNPGLNSNALPEGLYIRIPQDYKNHFENIDFKDHKVSRKETLFGIARQYNITPDVLIGINGDEKVTRLRKGDRIKVPTTNWLVKYDKLKTDVDSLKVFKSTLSPILVNKPESNIDFSAGNYSLSTSLIMPFNVIGDPSLSTPVNQIDSTEELTLDGTAISNRTRLVLEFYEGFLMAVEYYQKMGVNVNLQVLDTGNDNSNLNSLSNKLQNGKSDLIVGPVYPNHQKQLAPIIKQNKSIQVLPFHSTWTDLNNNPNIYQITSNDSLLYDIMAKSIADSINGKKVVLIKSVNNIENEQQFINQLKRNIPPDQMSEFVFSKGALARMEPYVNKETPTVFVLASKDEVFVNQVIIVLQAISDKGFGNLTLWGPPVWLKYSSIDPEAIHKLNGHIFSTYGVDYQDQTTQLFLTNYRELYKTEPFAFSPYFQRPVNGSNYSRYGIYGYDIGIHFIGLALRTKYQNSFSNSYDGHLIQSNFKFNSYTPFTGKVNQGLFIIRFNRDYSVDRLIVN